MKQFNFGDFVVYDNKVCLVVGMANDELVSVNGPGCIGVVPVDDVRKATKKEIAVHRLSEMDEDVFEGMFAALRFYDAELGRLENGQKDKPFNKEEYNAYVGYKCSNLETQCRIMYQFLMRLRGCHNE